jgi:hypothetical protein
MELKHKWVEHKGAPQNYTLHLDTKLEFRHLNLIEKTIGVASVTSEDAYSCVVKVGLLFEHEKVLGDIETRLGV